MEILFLLLFALALFYCVAFNYSVIFALLFGLLLFFCHGLIKGHSFSEMFSFTKTGLKKSEKIAVSMGLIGCLTAIWRASGTIAYIVFYASRFCIPSFMLLMTFWGCSLIAFLIGTAFGTAATIGTVCMTLGSSMGISPFLVGGAVLSGCYFGDRCSPISSTSLLVADITKTGIFANLINIIKTSFVPFLIASLVYLVLGLISDVMGSDPSTGQIFVDNFDLSHITALPIAFMLFLSFFHFEVRKTLSASIVIAAFIAVFWQGTSILQLPAILICGFEPENLELARIIGGGGLLSMWKVICIVVIGSCFSSIFEGTGFLDRIQKLVQDMDQKAGNFLTTLIVSVLSGFIACNTAFCVMLTCQLCDTSYENKSTLAVNLENTAVAVIPLIPWSISCALPLQTIGAPTASIFFAIYLIAVPIYNLIRARKQKKLETQSEINAINA